MATYEYEKTGGYDSEGINGGTGVTECWVGANRVIDNEKVTVYIEGAVHCVSPYYLDLYGVYVQVGHYGANGTPEFWTTEDWRCNAIFDGTSTWIPCTYDDSGAWQAVCKTYDEFYRTTEDYTVNIYCYYEGKTVDGIGGCPNSGNTYVTVTIPALDKYTVSYNANGGSGTMSSHTAYYGEQFSIKDCGFTRDGYTFVGWTTNSDGTNDNYGWYKNGAGWSGEWTWENEEYGISNYKLVLYARWKANAYEVTFNANGGETSTTSKTVTYDSNYGTLPTPTRTGYTFNGWYDASSGGTKVTSSTKVSIASDHTLYANWTINSYAYTLGSATGATTTGSTASGSKNYNTTITLKGSANTGYTWSRWDSSNTDLQADISTANTTFKMPAGDLTMTPVVTANTYTITYDANGGSGAPLKQTYTYDPNGTITLSTTIPTRPAYDFLGWSTSKDTEVATYVAGGKFNKNKASNTTLYAVWTLKASHVTIYNSDGKPQTGIIRFYTSDTNFVTSDGAIFKDSNNDYFMTSDSTAVHFGIIYIYREDGKPHIAI